ncbi:MAG: hypothetical protein Q9217_003649 [Psora testacea]
MDILPFFAREPTLLDKLWTTVQYPFKVFYHPIEALLSLPALSFLIIPAFSSYSTTLNFLFFYMTWAILIRSNPPLQVELFGTLGVRTLFYLLPSAGFLAFDSAAPQLAAGLKEHGDDALAMGEEQGGRKGRWWKITMISIANVVLAALSQTALEFLFTRVLRIRSALKITTTLPMPWSIAKDLVFGLLLREVLTYALHRYVLHGAGLRLAKWHKRWQHSILVPFSFVAHYDHPLAYLVHVFLPMYIPALFFRMHLLTYHIYLAIVSLEETFVYSGYNILPTAFILGGMARRQERHLMGNGKGNFGSFGFLDFVLGTSLGEDLIDDVVGEAHAKKVGKKAKGKAKSMKKGRKTSASDKEIDETVSEEQDEEELLRSRKRNTERKGKKTSIEGRRERNGDEEDDKPRRKPNNGLRKGRGRPKRPSDDDE